MTTSPPFLAFLQSGIERGGFQTDDVIAALLPLLRQVKGIHEQGFVAPLRGLEHLIVGEGGQLGVDATRLKPPAHNRARLAELERPAARAVEVIGEARQLADLERGAVEVEMLDVVEDPSRLTRPAYLTDYVTWEHAAGHHDALTDVLSLGLIGVSLACSLDLTDADDLRRLAAGRKNLFALNPALHPVVAAVLGQMVELARGARAQDLGTVIQRLETYRDQPRDLDLESLPGFAEAPRAGKRRLIQTHLRDRLFDISRRNRLLHFKSTMATLNLTVASVPTVLDYRNIRLEQLFVWHDELAGMFSRGETIQLGRWLRFEDAPYLPGVLDKILSQARRDRAEYGFSQLRLVLCFLRWHNLKEDREERIHSPLLLLPVELVRKKGVRDSYSLEPLSTEAEVNPALRHHLRQLYGLELPESVDLRETTMDAFHEDLRRQAQASEPGVTLQKIDKPQIQIIHARARQRVNQFRRRAELLARRTRKTSLDYSYERDDFRPLGIQLFAHTVRPEPLPVRDAAGADPAPRAPRLATDAGAVGTEEIERQCYALRDEEAATGNPYAWELDLCAVTLGNFNYRKMTLVRDYSRLLELDLENPAFDAIFSLAPKRIDEETAPALSSADASFVVPSDGAQGAALARARRGDSFIIQGPPGTGKSQTITNLIADFVARRKRVLFVCEKRAAIDVVYHRLRQQGLDGLCTLIHDSQADKRELIHDLKAVYEQYLAGAAPEGADEARTELLRQIERDLDVLGKFSAAMTSPVEHMGTSPRRVLERLLELRDPPRAAPGTVAGEGAPALSPQDQELLPSYRQWLEHGGIARRLETALADLEGERVFARHPLRHLGKAIPQAPRPLEALGQRLDLAEQLLGTLEAALGSSGLPADLWDTFEEIHALLDFAGRARDLAHRQLLSLLDARSEAAAGLQRALAEAADRARALAAAREKTCNWRDKLPPGEVETALREAQAHERSWLRALKPGYWRLRRILRKAYDFEQHVVRPSWSTALTELQAEHAAAAALAAVRERFRAEYGADDPQAFAQNVSFLREAPESQHPSVAQLRSQVASSPQGAGLILCLAELKAQLGSFGRELGILLAEHRGLTFPQLKAALADLRAGAAVLPDLVPILVELGEAPEELSRSLRRLPLGADALEAETAKRSLEQLYRADRQLEKLDGRALERRVERLGELWGQLMAQNAACLRASVRRGFLDHVSASSVPAAQLSPEQKAFKKSYAAGRRELEHEFGKTMRYKSIRDLAADDSGQVVRDLKPIWLMSPLSVSDTLPLDPALFDVVIFDEASQIPLEEAVPALYRARQVIVVGDEMQLPPTAFFAAARDESEDAVQVEEEGERFQVLLDASSFLNQAARNLPSTLLAWHYRSRYEALIGFSNAAFYAGRLNTIPDRTLPASSAAELRVGQAADGAAHVDELLRRSISFHFLENGRYDRRRNAPEGAYIAHLVRELLRRETRLSLGIVAFSEAQQTEIEDALERLAREDPDFERRLEEEYVREEHDQFCGLFVKNLENVQGDERDVIILSVCYGPGPDRRVLMNFGPINQQGGEKRLNVIFSRARQHMAVVTSMRHAEITNDFNDGARSLKGFLQYAEAVSRGDLATARRVLEELNPLARQALAPALPREAVVSSLAAALRQRGHAVDERVGQSRFRCDLGVRGDGAYRLGILVDTASHYGNPSLLERYVLQPAVLRSFGWQIEVVVAKDWLHEPAAVLSRLERRMKAANAPPASS